MRRVLSMLFILICLAGYSCQAGTPVLTPTLAPTSQPTPVPPPSATANPTAAPTPTQTQIPVTGPTGFRVRYHPDGGLFAGDQISFEISPPDGLIMDGSYVRVEVTSPEPQTLPIGTFYPYGIGQKMQATLVWGWDAQALAPGEYTLRFTVHPEQISWLETVTLLPREDLPLSEQRAAWAVAANACCSVQYLTYTEAERDLPQLLPIIDQQASLAIERMGIQFSQPITITLIPRLMGHGGFANNSIHVSYLDRNIALGQFDLIIQHEMVHILDRRLGGDLFPDLLVEGLAVYITGGHYLPGPLLPHAAALLDTWGNPPQPGLNRYLSLQSLANDFYASQHEIGYLQAGALVDFMVRTWGWTEFSAFYRDIHPHESGSQAQALDAALQVHFGLSLAQLEGDFIAALRLQPVTENMLEAVAFQISYMDTLRAYQRLLDPSAYFMQAWLLDTSLMRQRNITADYLRHPQGAKNLALETLLIHAGDRFRQGDFAQAASLLDSVRPVLLAMDLGEANPFADSPLARDYLSLAQTFLANPELSLDAELVRLEIENETARAWINYPTTGLLEIGFIRSEAGWQLQTPEPVSSDCNGS